MKTPNYKQGYCSNSTNKFNPSSLTNTAGKALGLGVLTSVLIAGCSGGGGSVGSTTPVTSNTIPSTEISLREVSDGPISSPVITENIPAGNGITASCTTTAWEESEVRTLVDTVGLNATSSTIFPGALIESKPLNDNGEFSVIKIPRAPADIFMSGLLLEPGSTYTAQNIDMSAASVNQAVSQLITDNGITGTSANFGFTESETYSYEKMLFDLGIDGRYKNATMSADLNIATESTRNYSFVKFTQVYYDMHFDDSTLTQPTDVFRDGANFSDSRNQISDDNPPLYVSKVSYGRMVFFVAESTHDAKEVAAALKGALSGGFAGEVAVETGLTHQEILARSKVYYHVIGGSAGLALAPLDATSPENMYDAVKQFIKDPQSANFSASNPGAVVAYTLKYLKDSRDARMSYSVNYDKNQCEFTRPPTIAPTTPNYRLQVSNISAGEVTVFVNGEHCGTPTKTAKEYRIYQCLKPETVNDIRVSFNTSFGCKPTSVTWYITGDGRSHHASGNPILWPTRANGILVTSAQFNESKCNDFYWTSTIDTSVKEDVSRYAFSGYAFIP